MLQFDPNDPEEMAFTLHKAVKKSRSDSRTDRTAPGRSAHLRGFVEIVRLHSGQLAVWI